MEPIITYRNYRAYIQDFYNEQKAFKALTWQSFARKAGFTATSHLKLVSLGKTNLSEDCIDSTADSMNLTGHEKEYFKGLVHFNQAKCASEKIRAYEEISAIATKYKAKLITGDLFEYLSNWQNIVIRELATLAPPNTKTSNIARQLYPEITAAQAGKSLRFLEKKGLLQKQEDGTYRQTDKILSTGDEDVTSIALHSYHRTMAEFALKAIDEVPIEERNVSEVVVGVSKEVYQQISREISNFRKHILALAMSSEKIDRIYCMQTNLFPVSHKISDKSRKEKEK